VLLTGGGRPPNASTPVKPSSRPSCVSSHQTWTTMVRAQRPRCITSTRCCCRRRCSRGGGRSLDFDNIESSREFTQAYLFHVARPVATSAPATIPLGRASSSGPVADRSPGSRPGPSAVTHSVNMHQRGFSRAGVPADNRRTEPSSAAHRQPSRRWHLHALPDRHEECRHRVVRDGQPPSNPCPDPGLSPVSATAAAGFALT